MENHVFEGRDFVPEHGEAEKKLYRDSFKKLEEFLPDQSWLETQHAHIISKHLGEDGRVLTGDWPGKNRYVRHWWRSGCVRDGRVLCVGLKESPTSGWSFPIAYTK